MPDDYANCHPAPWDDLCDPLVIPTGDRRFVDALDIRHQEFLAFWLSRRTGTGMVLKRSITPEVLKQILPNLILLESVEDKTRKYGRRFRHRLVGTVHHSFVGKELTGEWVDEVIPPDRNAQQEAQFARILTGRSPYFWHSASAIPGHEHNWFKAVIAPVSSNGVSNDMILACVIWES